MFGHHKARRATKRLKKDQSAFTQQKKEYDDQSPERDKAAMASQDQLVNQKSEQAKQNRKKDYDYGRERGEEIISRNYQGLTPERRKELQYEASRNIDRSMEGAQRRLLGDQGQRGITGKSGVAYAQQRDLQNVGQEAQGQATRDLNKLDSQLAMQKLAQVVGLEQGEAAQGLLERQGALDEIQLADEKKRQRALDDQLNRLFMNRI